MKKLALFTLLLLVPLAGFSQSKESSSFTERIGYLKFDGVDGVFKSNLMSATKPIDKCSKRPATCNLIDPVKNKKASAISQIEKGWSWGASQSAVSQKSMATFEKYISKNKQNPLLPWTTIQAAFKKHPGYSHDAMVSRMKLYILSMESIEDDE